ncbi:MAG: hypothetical protein IKL07_06170 [Clostridium sp.]|nr:hypothetical protein [Clostridium sp.]
MVDKGIAKLHPDLHWINTKMLEKCKKEGLLLSIKMNYTQRDEIRMDRKSGTQ